MKRQEVTIKNIKHVTHDVLQIVAEKPPGLVFEPGQATEVFVTAKGWENEGRPFTFTSLPGDDHVEFTIKTYPARQGVTNELLKLGRGDKLILNDVFGEIGYKGEGVFIAGGAGITPFISILRELASRNAVGRNKLIFANKSKADIIYKEELGKLLGNNFINILSEDHLPGYASGFITEDFLKEHIKDHNVFVYVCGPPPMMEIVLKILKNLGVKEDYIVQESF
jgi:ferredoxin-NADP reductase